MPDSLGSLVDRLSILNLKLWHVQDRVFQAADAGEGLDADTTSKLATLNLERNRTMSEIDHCLDQAVKSGGARVESRIKLVD